MSGQGNAERWPRVSRHNPCPICEQDHYCKVTEDGAIAGCMRVQYGAYRTVDTDLGPMYLHRLTDTPLEAPPPRPTAPDAPQRNTIADRVVYALAMEICAPLPNFAGAELERRFGTRGRAIAAAQRIGYCDGPALLAAIKRAGRRREAIAAGVLNGDGSVSRSLLGRLVIPYLRDGLVHDLRGAGIKGRDETKEISLRGPYAERGVADLFYNDDALRDCGPDGVLHLAGGAYKTMALLAAGLNAAGLRGEGELSDGHIARLVAAGVRTIILHIDAEDPKEGQARSAGRRLGLQKAEKLAAAGITTAIAEPPREPGTPKVDPDALLRDLGPRAVRDYALSAIPLDAWRVVIGVDAPGVPPEVAEEREELHGQLREKVRLISALTSLERAKGIKAQKPAIFAAATVYANRKGAGRVDADGWALTSRAELGDIGGRSNDAIGEQLDTVASWGIGFEKQARHEDVRRVDESGQVVVERRKRLYIRVNGEVADVLEKAALFDPPKAMRKDGTEQAGWGGKREPCPRCGSQRRRTVVTCVDCALEFSDKVSEPGPGPDTVADVPERPDEPASIPPTPVVVPESTATYPPGDVTYHVTASGPVRVAEEDDETDADDWDPYFCNHIDHTGRQCTARIDPGLGKRWCWQHRPGPSAIRVADQPSPCNEDVPGAEKKGAAFALGGVRYGSPPRSPERVGDDPEVMSFTRGNDITGAAPSLERSKDGLTSEPKRFGLAPQSSLRGEKPAHRPWCLNYQGQGRGCQHRVDRSGERYCPACASEGFTNGPEVHDAADN